MGEVPLDVALSRVRDTILSDPVFARRVVIQHAGSWFGGQGTGCGVLAGLTAFCIALYYSLRPYTSVELDD